jgi:prepilin-type N-terminal cleavage/methylation domain-containing protein
MKKYTKGFTLIELLVVIAIIGILSSVVLVSLNTARGKGNVAKIQAQVNSARAAAEIYYSNASPNGYSSATTCTTGMFADSTSGFATYTNTANYPSGSTPTCNAIGTGYAFAITYTGTSPTTYVCIDSKGNSLSTTTDITGNTRVTSTTDPKCQ